MNNTLYHIMEQKRMHQQIAEVLACDSCELEISAKCVAELVTWCIILHPGAESRRLRCSWVVQMLAEGTLRWELTAPRIISTDGTLDGNTATYEIPLSSMVTGRPKSFSKSAT